MSKRQKATTATSNLNPPGPAVNLSPLAADAVPPVVGLDCGVCLERFNEASRAPLLLTCGHTYCAACLGGLIKGAVAAGSGKITCPSGDRIVTSVPGTDAMSLPKNWVMVSQVAAATAALPAAGEARCVLCDDLHGATHRCLHCQQDMCESQVRAHRRLSMSMSHRVVTQAEFRADPSMGEEVVVQLCKGHGKPLELFDMHCRQYLCALCMVTHTGHRVLALTEAAPVCRAELGDWSQRLDAWAARADLSIHHVERRLEKVEASHETEADKIRAAYNQVLLPGFFFFHFLLHRHGGH
jgi:hypothetical protein